MIRTFREFVSEREAQRGFRRQLLSKLGNLADDTISIRAFRDGQVERAVQSITGLDDGKKQDLMDFVRNHPDSRLRDLIHQYGGSSGDLSQSDGDLAGADAQLPEGEPKPAKKPKPDAGGMPQAGMPNMPQANPLQ